MPEPVPPPPRRVLLPRLLAGALVAALAVFAHSTGWFSAFGGTPHGQRLARMKRSPAYAEGRFRGPGSAARPGAWERGASAARALFASPGPDGRAGVVPAGANPAGASEGARPAGPPDGGLRVSWLGHATVLVEIDGARILTDPIFGERASPSTLVGPVRLGAPPLRLDLVPRLDAIVVSHDHYDHLDQRAITGLATTGAPIVVPLGVGAHLEKWGIPSSQIRELDWWEEVRVGPTPIVIAATPARHASGRGPFDADATLWSSYALRGPRHAVFFSGATGLFEGLAEIGDTFGPFDVTLLDVGASCAGGAGAHLGADAVAAHRQLRGRVLLPIHWGTYAVGGDPRGALGAVLEGAAAAGLDVRSARAGEILDLSRDAPRSAVARRVR